MGGGYCLLGLAVVVLCALAFYIISPFMVRFSKWHAKESEQEEVNFGANENRSGFDNENEIFSN